jgi:hypothetical protein
MDCQGLHPGIRCPGDRPEVPFVMAGKFLSLEETARRLGVTVEEVNRLIDRKELFPMRGGGTIKFKLEEIERVANDRGSAGSNANDDLSLDLDMSAPGLSGGPSTSGGAASLIIAGGDDEDDSIFSDDADEPDRAVSQTMLGGPGKASDGPSGAFDVDELGLDSLISTSTPALSGDGGTMPPSSRYGESGTLEIDLADIEGSLVGGSLPSVSGIGGGASGAIDSGLSLEGDFEASGIDLAKPSEAGDPSATGVGLMSASLAGDAFDLGADLSDEESASVVIATEETGDSSFFDAAADDSASVSFDGSGSAVDFAGAAGIALEGMDVVPASPPITVWQGVGLICCTFLMILVGLVVFDVLQTVRAPQGTPVTAPVLNALTKAFGW